MKHYIAGNWKMNKTPSESKKFAKELKDALSNTDVKVMIAPSFTNLQAVSEVVSGSNIILGAQNISLAEDGAHTGEVSALMLKDLGVKSVIIGHSERRLVYHEDDYLICAKVAKALKHNFEVVLCIGETLAQREAGILEDVLKIQIASGLANVSEDQLAHVVLAYEPVWAIGTGKTATPDDAESVHAFVRKTVGKLYPNSKNVQNLCIQYGGSVKPDNAKELMAKPNINGALVGGASLKVQDFKAIIDAV